MVEPGGAQPPEQRPDEWLPPGSSRQPANPRPPEPRRSPEPRRPAEPGGITGRWPDPPTWPAWQPPRTTSAPSRTPWYVPAVVITVVVVLLIAFAVVAGRSVAGLLERPRYVERPERPEFPSPRPTAPEVPERPVTVPWRLEPAALRPDLGGAEFVGPVDGDFSGPYVSAVDPKVADVWVTLTGDREERSMAAHGIDPATGQKLWDRPMEGGLCAAEADRHGVACAELLDRDRGTGLGRKWRLHLLDPRTGEPRISRDVDGWFSALHRSGDTLVVLEQREPYPHAALRGFDLATLKPLWELDLSKVPGHEHLFSENRIIARKDPDREGVVMDRPRFRDVGYGAKADRTGGDGLMALWAGQRTAFVQPRTGKLIMMPQCSRLVDDGRRLWCNEPDGAQSYSYAGKALRRVSGPRLAFPGDDGVGVDRNRPIFIDHNGAPVAVDPDTGKVGKPYSVPGAGSAFGETTMPGAESVGEHTFLVGDGGAMLVHPEQDKITWINKYITHTDTPILIKDELLLGSYRADVVDLATGERRATAKLEGLYTVAVGSRVAGVGPDLLCLQQFG